MKNSALARLFALGGVVLTAAANWLVGKPEVSPVFTGKGVFTVDDTVAPGAFVGSIAAGRLTSSDPATTKAPVQLPRVPLTLIGEIVMVPLVGVRIAYTIGP